MSKKKQRKKLPAREKNEPGKIEQPRLPNFQFSQHRWPLLILFLAAIALYFQTVNFDYALDDKMVIVENKFTQQGIGGIGDIFRYESFRGYFGEQRALLEGDRYRPLSIASFAAEQDITGGNKAISHFLNVLLYALTGLLLYRLMFLMFPGRGHSKWYFTAPFIITLLYILHPLHVEVVANIKGRDELLALLGELGCLYFSFRFTSGKKKRFLFFSFLSIFLAMLSKEGAVTFLAVVPLTIHFFTRAGNREKFLVTLPVLAAVITYLIIRVNAIGYLLSGEEVTDLMNNPFYGMTMGERTATIFHTLLIYLKLHLVPYPLTHDYYPYHIPVMRWNQWQPILSLLIHVFLVAVIIKGWKKKTTWAYCALFYLATISIVSNLVVSVGTFMNERFAYHASLAFCIAAGYFLSGYGRARLSKPVAAIITAILITGFATLTLVRLPDWKNDQALDRSAIKLSPNSARANCFYGIYLWQQVYLQLPPENISRKIAVLDSMKYYFDKSVSILPAYYSAHTMRAGVAAEYHKLNGNYDSLLDVFASINFSGVNEPFVISYLDYLNKIVNNRTDANKLAAHYARMRAYYQSQPANPLFNQYSVFEQVIQSRLSTLN